MNSSSPHSGKNPVERELQRLSEQWNEFVLQSDKQVLRWIVDDDAARIIDAWIETQNEAELAENADLFLRFDSPCESAKSYGTQLTEELAAKYAEGKAALEELELPTDWECPRPVPNLTAVNLFARATESFLEKYGDEMDHLVVYLRPAVAPDAHEWRLFLHDYFRIHHPRKLRIVIQDSATDPLLSDVSRHHRERVQNVRARIDMQKTIRDLASTTGSAGPGKDFRELFVECSQLAGKGSTPQFLSKARKLLQLTRDQGWLPQEFAVFMLVAAAHLSSSKMKEGVAAYRDAGDAARKAIEAGDAVGHKLAMQAKLGEGGAFVGDKQFAKAARTYEQAAALATPAEDPLMELEAIRMAGFCHEQDGKLKQSWKCYWKAVKIGEAMDSEARETTSLPFVGQGLLRLTKSKKMLKVIPRRSPYAGQDKKVRKKMVELLGRNWEDALPQGS